MSNYRIAKDTMGEIRVPVDAHYGAQTQRAVENFPISGLSAAIVDGVLRNERESCLCALTPSCRANNAI